MSPTINLKALPLHRLLALAGATFLLISLFLPWQMLSIDDELEEIMGVTSDDAISGWDGLGRFAGVAALAILIFEIARLMRRAARTQGQADLLTILLSGVAAVLAIAQFARAISDSAPGFASMAPGYGAYLILISGLALIGAVVIGIKKVGWLAPRSPYAGNAIATPPPPPPPPPTGTPTPPPPPAGPQDM